MALKQTSLGRGPLCTFIEHKTEIHLNVCCLFNDAISSLHCVQPYARVMTE